MAIDVPARDNPDFEALVTEAVTQIPRLSPGWTDYNPSDPGITLIELLAVATELGSFQVERTDAARHRAFARRFGLTPAPPTSADTVVQLQPTKVTRRDHGIPADTQIRSDAGVVFSTQAPLHLQPAQGDPAIMCAGAVGPGWTDTLCHPLGTEPAPGASFTLRFEQPIESEVSLYVWTGAADHDRELRARLTRAAAENRCVTGASAHYAARLSWESLARNGEWVPATVVADETRALTLSGFVRLRLRAEHAGDDGAYPVRCRLIAGGYDCGPTLRRVLVNAVAARHDRELQPASAWWLLGFSAGRAGQRFLLPDQPALFERCEVHVVPPEELPPGAADYLGKSIAVSPHAGQAWHVVLSWDRTGPHDRHVLLDPPSGALASGDGRIGSVPPAGHAIVARCRYGGGSGGNIPAGSLTRIAGPAADVTVTQPFAAAGGTDRETVKDLRSRVLEHRGRLRRGVSLADLEVLATRLPGLPVARAWALAEHHPQVPGLVASGCITLVVIPPCPDARPTPSRELLDAVARGLEHARPLTTQLVVTSPRYTPIAIAARLHLAPGADPARARQQAVDAFAGWIHPLRGGPNRDGWPPGRNLHRAEVMALLMALDAVRAVDDFTFLIDRRRSRCESAPACAHALFTATDHQLTFVQEA